MKKNPIAQFSEERKQRISSYKGSVLEKAASKFMVESTIPKYSYNFSYLGHPIIQYPQDIIEMQELIWAIKPDLIVETGIAHGGSLMLSASMLALLDYSDAVESGKSLDPKESRRRILGIDIDIRPHNRLATRDSYCVVFDTVIEYLPVGMFSDRPWGKGNNPKTAVCEYIKFHPEFKMDKEIQHKLLITVAPDGFLKRI